MMRAHNSGLNEPNGKQIELQTALQGLPRAPQLARNSMSLLKQSRQPAAAEQSCDDGSRRPPTGGYFRILERVETTGGRLREASRRPSSTRTPTRHTTGALTPHTFYPAMSTLWFGMNEAEPWGSTLPLSSASFIPTRAYSGGGKEV